MLGKFISSSAIVSSLTLIGCKSQPPAIDKPATFAGKSPTAAFYASSQTEVRAKNNFYFALFNKEYELKFDLLPVSGEVTPDRVPYSGGFYLQTGGGTNSRVSGPGALDKYDGVFNLGSSPKAAEWEKKYHTIPSTDEAAGWAGHCNGFAAAASRHAEPKQSVIRGTTTFLPTDIKALMAEIHFGVKYYFLGGNRCGLNEASALMPPGAREDPITLDGCDDVNPGSFHIAMTNWIGIQKRPIILDIHGKLQVWNYPHWKYLVASREVSMADAVRIITGDTAATTYPFNPAAKKFRSVAMTLTHTDAFKDEIMTSQVAAAKRFQALSYNYILELDTSGTIIGGEWVSASQKDHPDFVWVALEPVHGDGTAYSSNPNLEVQEVLKLWAESVGANPSSPPAVLMEPSLAKEWGRFPKFDVQVNGGATGVAFAFDDVVEITLKPKAALTGAVVEALLDGTKLSLAPLKASVSNVSSGIHVLEIKWTLAGNVVDEQRARIHVIR